MESSRNTGSRVVENLPVVSQDLPSFVQDRVAEFFLFSLFDACKAFGVDVKVGFPRAFLSRIIIVKRRRIIPLICFSQMDNCKLWIHQSTQGKASAVGSVAVDLERDGRIYWFVDLANLGGDQAYSSFITTIKDILIEICHCI